MHSVKRPCGSITWDPLLGLPAKPVIDIQVSVRDVKDEPSYGKAIESLGWPLRAGDEVVLRGHVLPSSSDAPGSEMACRPSMLGSRAISAVPMTDEYFRGNAAAIPESRIDRHVRVWLQVLKDVVEHAARSELRPGDDLGFA
jgi:hypothetical protein